MASTYKLGQGASVFETDDDAIVWSFAYDAGAPPAALSGRAQRYRTWLAAGNTPTAADPVAALQHAGGYFTGDAHTSGAASAEMLRATLPTLSQFNVSMQASGIALDNGAQRTVWVLAVVQRLNGTASVIGQTVIGNIPSGAGSPVPLTAFALTASGNDIVIAVTGLAGREIDWVLDGEYLRIRPAGLS